MTEVQTRLDGGINVPVIYAGGCTEVWYPCPGPNPVTGHSWMVEEDEE